MMVRILWASSIAVLDLHTVASAAALSGAQTLRSFTCTVFQYVMATLARLLFKTLARLTPAHRFIAFTFVLTSSLHSPLGEGNATRVPMFGRQPGVFHQL